MITEETPEFSRPIAADRIPAAGTEMNIEALPAERAALARRFDIPEIKALTAHLRLKPIAGGPLVRVWGRFDAQVVQTCVVTLQPLDSRVAEDFELTYGPDDEGDDEDDLEIHFDVDDPPEAYSGGVIDLGEAVAEHLSLALDPFPRAKGAVFEAPAEEEEETGTQPSPFAVLAGLRQKKG